MKKFVKSLCIAAMLLITTCCLIACDGGSADPTTLVGTWENSNASITRIQFIKDTDIEQGKPERGSVSYYLKGESLPNQGTYSCTSADGKTYTVVLGYSAYKAELKDGKLVMSLEDNSFNETYTKKYDK